MESKAKLFGHPIHPMLIVFPLGLFVTAVIFDIIFLATDEPRFALVSYYTILAGLIGGLLAGIFGFRDFYAIPRDTRAKRVAFWHGLGNVALMLLFSFSWLIRRNTSDFIPPVMALLTSFLGLGLGTLTAWLGGELVYRLGMGVDEGANLNAPNSMITDDTRQVGMEQVPITGQTRTLNDPELTEGEDVMDEP